MTARGRTPSWRRYLRFWGANADADVDDELRFHVDMRADEYIAHGLAPDEARRLAEHRFGDSKRARDACLAIDERATRASGRADWLTALEQDLLFAARLLSRQRLATLLAVACLTLGIGATTSMFSVADALLLRPLPFPNGARLMYLGTARRGEHSATVTSYPDYLDWRTRQRSFDDLAAYGTVNLTVIGHDAYLVNGMLVTASYFHVLGVAPERGRLFIDDEDEPGSAAVAIVSHGFADRTLGGDEQAIGKTIVVRGDRAGAPDARTVVGVVPDQTLLPGDVWLPIVRNPNLTRNNHNLSVLGLVRRGVSFAAAGKEIADIEQQVAVEQRDEDGDLTAFGRPLVEQYVGPVRPALEAMFAATVLVLLVACANVGGIQLARAVAREREIAVRRAIGAGRGRILRQLLTESILLSLGGGAAGVVVAYYTNRFAARAVIGTVPGWVSTSIDWRVLAFAVGTAALTGIAFGVAPAMRLARIDPADALRGGTARVGPARPTLQQGFVVAQIALSIVLVVLATLSIQAVRSLENIVLGFDKSNVLVYKLVFQSAQYDSMAARARAVAAIAEGVRGLPGVDGSGAVSMAPLSCCSQWAVEVEGHPLAPGQHRIFTGNSVTPGYFAAMRVGLHRGRDFTADDTPTSEPVIIINQTFADQYWAGGGAIGKRVHFGPQWATVVGVVNDIKQAGLLDDPEPQFYLPVSQYVMTRSAFVVRSSGRETDALTAAIRRVVHDVDPTLAVYGVRTLDETVSMATASRRAFEALMIVFGTVALGLAATGIFAVMSFVVAQRRREMGVRLALGAAPSRVTALVLGQGARLGIVGTVVGVAAALVAARALAHTLYGVNPRDPLVYLAAVAVAAAAIVLASVGPARRAARVDPVAALRLE